MATIEVKGSITRVFYEGKGLEVTESFQNRAGETVKRSYTVWLNQPGLFDVGDSVSVKGLFSADIDDWTNPDGSPKLNRDGNPGRSVKVSINNPQVIPQEPSNNSVFEPTHTPAPF